MSYSNNNNYNSEDYYQRNDSYHALENNQSINNNDQQQYYNNNNDGGEDQNYQNAFNNNNDEQQDGELEENDSYGQGQEQQQKQLENEIFEKDQKKGFYNMSYILWFIPFLPGVCLLFSINLIELIWACIVHHIAGIIFPILALILCIVELLFYYNIVKIDLKEKNKKFYFKQFHLLNRVLINILTFMAIIFLIIRIQNNNPAFSHTIFPYKCNKPDNCSRIAEFGDQNATKQPMELLVKMPTVQKFVLDYVKNYGFSARVVTNSQCYIVSEIINGFWGSIDDFGINFCCLNMVSLVQGQSESRVSDGNFQENQKRLDDFYKQLLDFEMTVELDTAGCYDQIGDDDDDDDDFTGDDDDDDDDDDDFIGDDDDDDDDNDYTNQTINNIYQRPNKFYKINDTDY